MVTSAYALSANTTMTVRMKIRHIDRPAVTDTGGARKELSIPHHPVSPGRGMLLRLPTLDVRTAHRGSALRSHHSHQRQQPAIPEGMYKRAIKPIREFLSSPPPEGVYIIDCQFGKINYVSGDISPVITSRINADGVYYVIEVI